MNIENVKSVDELTAEQKADLTENGYYYYKFVGDKFCALRRFFTTVGLVVGINDTGIERRYCFEDQSDALVALSIYDNPNEHPSGPWLKVKGKMNGQYLDEWNPLFLKAES